jgi:hypothetical protein
MNVIRKILLYKAKVDEKRLFIYILLQILIFSCQDSGVISVINKNQKKYANHCKLSEPVIKEFPLDNESIADVDCIQFIDNDTGSYFSFVNNYNNSIYFYDYESSSFIRKIKYEKEGPNGVLNIQGHSYLNDDSIFIYSYNSYILYLTNAQGKVSDKFKIYEAPKKLIDIILPAPYIQTCTPILRERENLFLFGFVADETDIETPDNRPVCVWVNMKTKEQKYLINYPVQYAKYNWGGGFTYRFPSTCMDKTSFLVSFPAHHDIIKYSFSDGTQTQFYAGSSLIEEIKPLSKSKGYVENNAEWEWYMKNASYEGIWYDKYKNLYYRVARLPKNDFKPNERGNKKPIVIIVLNEKLEYTGEVKLPEKIDFRTVNCFVSKDGFNIQVDTDDEDKLTYYQYNFK